MRLMTRCKVHMASIDKIIAQSAHPNAELWLNEAKFGHQHLLKYCRELAAGSSVLEVGCGSGILLAMLRESISDVEFHGIEPFGEGFDGLRELNKLLQETGTTIQNVGYEDFRPERPVDLIYSVNVFEHLDDWRDFLGFVERNLSADGVCVTMCPNYNVPYESHFRIPILLNKRTTKAVFHRSISRFENINNCHGLWESLNFVKLSEVKKATKRTGLSLRINHEITNYMIDRLSSDEEFRKRQRSLSIIGSLIKKLGLTRLLKIGFLENYQPYMMLEMRR